MADLMGDAAHEHAAPVAQAAAADDNDLDLERLGLISDDPCRIAMTTVGFDPAGKAAAKMRLRFIEDLPDFFFGGVG